MSIIRICISVQVSPSRTMLSQVMKQFQRLLPRGSSARIANKSFKHTSNIKHQTSNINHQTNTYLLDSGRPIPGTTYSIVPLVQQYRLQLCLFKLSSKPTALLPNPTISFLEHWDPLEFLFTLLLDMYFIGALHMRQQRTTEREDDLHQRT
jgi:hypothetical protein